MARKTGRGRSASRPQRDKSPAYQWYPKDALSDIDMMVMTNETEGLYRRLMDHAWLEDGLPGNLAFIFPLSKCESHEKFEQLWMQIEPLFPIDDDGRRRNKRQERERAKQRKNSRLRKLAANTRWNREHANADAHALQTRTAVVVDAAAVQCLPIAIALPIPLADTDQKEPEISAPERRALPAPGGSVVHRSLRMRLSVWEVRPHLLAAVHQLIASGRPYVDEHGTPAPDELIEALKTIASRDLHADWEGRELHAILDAALGRRAIEREADVARDGFRRRERRQLADLPQRRFRGQSS
jgi:uncharacterized protein YdaU (DUF1376 family)